MKETRVADIFDIPGENTRAAEAARRLSDDLKVPSLSGLGVEEKKFNAVVKEMAADAIANGSRGNNPRKATRDEIVELCKKAF